MNFEILFALAQPFVEMGSRAKFRRYCEELRSNSPTATVFRCEECFFPFDEDCARSLGTALEENTHLRDLRLDVSHLRRPQSQGVQRLAAFLQTSRNLVRVDLTGQQQQQQGQGNNNNNNNNNSNNQVNDVFFNAMAQNPNIRRLGLQGTRLGTNGFTALLRRATTLQEIFISDCELTMSAARARSIGRAFGQNASIKLFCAGNMSVRFMKAMLRNATTHPTLQTLSIMDPTGDLSLDLRQVLAENENLREFTFGGNPNDDDDDDNNEQQQQQRQQPTAMEHLLQGLRQSRSIKTIWLHHCSFNAASARLMRDFVRSNTRIERIDLSNNEMDNDTLAIILPGLYRNSTVVHLDLSYNRISGVRGGQAIRDLLRRTRFLQRLELDHNPLGSVGAGIIAQGLPRNQSVNFVGLSRCFVGNEGMEDIAESLVNNTVVSTLVLADNSIEATGVSSIMQMLARRQSNTPEAPSLALILNANPVGDEGATLIAETLREHNSAIGELYMDNCEMEEEGVAAIVGSLGGENNSNQSLRVLDIEGNRVGQQGADALIATLPQMKGLKRLLFTMNDYMRTDPMENALLNALDKNYSIDSLRISRNSFSAEGDARLAYIAKRNRLIPLLNAPTEQIPLGLWPRVFERFMSANEEGGAQGATLSAVFYCLQQRAADLINAPNAAAASPKRGRDATASRAAAAAPKRGRKRSRRHQS